MFKKIVLATVLLTLVSPSAFADKKKPVPPPKPPITSTKAPIDDGLTLLQFEVQKGTVEQQ